MVATASAIDLTGTQAPFSHSSGSCLGAAKRRHDTGRWPCAAPWPTWIIFAARRSPRLAALVGPETRPNSLSRRQMVVVRVSRALSGAVDRPGSRGHAAHGDRRDQCRHGPGGTAVRPEPGRGFADRRPEQNQLLRFRRSRRAGTHVPAGGRQYRHDATGREHACRPASALDHRGRSPVDTFPSVAASLAGAGDRGVQGVPAQPDNATTKADTDGGGA